MDKQAKLQVLADIAGALNGEGVTWAVGGSLLLWFKGIADDFHDIDLSLAPEDVPKALRCLSRVGTQREVKPNDRFRSACFLSFLIAGVEVDVIAGLVIVCGEESHAFPLTRAQIAEQIDVCGERIPLQSVQDWKHYYALMGRESKVQLIQAHESANVQSGS